MHRKTAKNVEAAVLAALLAVVAWQLWPCCPTPVASAPPARPIEPEPSTDTTRVVPVLPGSCVGPVVPGPFHRRPVPPLDAVLVSLFQRYLDWESEDAYKHRLPLIERLEKDLAGGRDVLGDLDTLSSILYAARPFKAVYSKRSIGWEDSIHTDDSGEVTRVAIAAREKGDGPLRLSFRLPRGYDSPPGARHLNAVAPYPVIVTLDDAPRSKPAAEASSSFRDDVITRRYASRGSVRPRFATEGPFAPLLEEWIVLAPAAPEGGYLVDGKVDATSVVRPLSEFWKRYHVDFDRIVLEGGSEALALAAQQPIWFAGVIVRGDDADISPDLVPNFAHLPVYVVGRSDGAAAKSLLAGGMWPTVGPPEGIPPWIEHVRRVVPRKFHWNVADPQRHVLAHWINVNEVVPGANERTLDVAVLDTETDPNTVKVEASGISEMTIFLSDRVADLSRPVRILVNGQIARPPVLFERGLDRTFTSKRFNLLKSQYYGWLFPVRVEGISVLGK